MILIFNIKTFWVHRFRHKEFLGAKMPPLAPSAGFYSVLLGRLPVVSLPTSASLPCRALRSVEDRRSVRLQSTSVFPHLICHRRCRTAMSIPKFDQLGDKTKGDSSFFKENDDDDKQVPAFFSFCHFLLFFFFFL